MTDSPKPHPDPEIRAYIRRCGGYSAFAAQHGLSLRTAQRIFSGASLCPPAMREQILGHRGREITGKWVNELEGGQ